MWSWWESNPRPNIFKNHKLQACTSFFFPGLEYHGCKPETILICHFQQPDQYTFPFTLKTQVCLLQCDQAAIATSPKISARRPSTLPSKETVVSTFVVSVFALNSTPLFCLPIFLNLCCRSQSAPKTNNFSQELLHP